MIIKTYIVVLIWISLVTSEKVYFFHVTAHLDFYFCEMTVFFEYCELLYNSFQFIRVIRAQL